MRPIFPSLRGRIRLAAAAMLPLIAGCTSFLPSTSLPTPVLRHAGQVQATLTEGCFGMSGAGAGMITDNLGLGGLISTNSQKDELYTSSYSSGEGMLIFSQPFRGGSAIALFAGAGAGKTSYASSNSDLRGQFTRFFVQALFGSTLERLTTKDTSAPFIEGGVTLRASRFNFHDMYASGWSTGISGVSFLEPGLFCRGVWGIFTVGGQVGFEFPLGSTENLPFATTSIALELGIRFGDADSSPLEP